MTHRIVQGMGGHIKLQSVLAQGSTFEIFLPDMPIASLADSAAPNERPPVAAPTQETTQPTWGPEAIPPAARARRPQLVTSLESGRIRVDPFKLEVPGGSLGIRVAYLATSKQVSLDLGMDLHHFDYGVLARYLDPETEMGGTISLDVDLKAKGANSEVLMDDASGHVDFALIPEEFEAGVIDLWSVNLVASVLPTLDTAPKSVVECLIAQLDIRDGLVTERVLVVDTTRMRISGKASIDMKQETIALVFAPVAKRPEFFSLSTPVRVEGSFDDFGVGVHPEDVIGTVIRFVTSVVVVPVQRLIGLNTDLTDDAICQRGLERRDDLPK